MCLVPYLLITYLLTYYLLITYLLTYLLITCLLTYLLTYLLAYLLITYLILTYLLITYLLTYLLLTYYLLTYSLTPCSRVLLQKLTGSAASKEIPRIFGTQRFLAVLTSALHLSLSWANSIQSPQPLPTSWRSILISSCHLRLGLPNRSLYTRSIIWCDINWQFFISLMNC